MHIHICLVSAQLLANYIPIRMDKPEQVHLVSSAEMQRNGMTARFQRMLQAQHTAPVNPRVKCWIVRKTVVSVSSALRASKAYAKKSLAG